MTFFAVILLFLHADVDKTRQICILLGGYFLYYPQAIRNIHTLQNSIVLALFQQIVSMFPISHSWYQKVYIVLIHHQSTAGCIKRMRRFIAGLYVYIKSY